MSDMALPVPMAMDLTEIQQAFQRVQMWLDQEIPSLANDETVTGLWSFSSGIKLDNIYELTANAGVLVDSVKLKDGNVYTDNIDELNAAHGVVVDGVTIKDGGLTATAQILAYAGTKTTPAVAWASAASTGLYFRPGTMNVSVVDTDVLEFTNTGMTAAVPLAMGGNSITGVDNLYLGDDGIIGIEHYCTLVFDLTPNPYTITLTNADFMFGSSKLTLGGQITLSGANLTCAGAETVDGRDVSADGAKLDTLYTTIGLSALTSVEVDQLENIGAATISSTQWGYLGAMDQGVAQADSPVFAKLTCDTTELDNNQLRATTADGSDNSSVTVCGGGSFGNTRGAGIWLVGNEGDTNYRGMAMIKLGAPTSPVNYDGKFVVMDGANALLATMGPLIADGMNLYGPLNMNGQHITGLSTTGEIQFDAGCKIAMPGDSVITYTADGSHAFAGAVTMDTSLLLSAGNITLAALATVDGRDLSVDGAKLDGIETAADVTDATNVNAAGATMNADTDVSANGWVVDEDNMVSNLATKVPTQQSVKAYVDASGGGPTYIVKTADEIVNNSAAFQDDDDLTFAVTSGKKYYFKFLVYLTTTAVADFKFQLTGPAVTATKYYTFSYGATTANTVHTAFSDAETLDFWADQAGVWLVIEGYANPSANGDITLQWAQDTAEATDTKMLIGSMVIYQDIT